MFEFEFWFGSGWFSRKVGIGRGVRWMFAFGVLGNDAILEQLAWFRDMACSRTDCSERFWCEPSDWASDLIGVRLGVVKFEICGVEVRVGLEESRRIMASGFIILKKNHKLSKNIYGFQGTWIVRNDWHEFLDFDLAQFWYFRYFDHHQNNSQHHWSIVMYILILCQYNFHFSGLLPIFTKVPRTATVGQS